MLASLDSPWLLLVLVALLLASYWGGSQLSRRCLTAPSVEVALMAWLGLFLAGTFVQVGQVCRERTRLVHEEADSIAQTYRALQTLPQGQRTQMRLLLIAYVDAKLRSNVAVSEQVNQAQEIIGLQSQLYSLSCDLATRKILTDSQGLSLVQTINGMISLHYRRVYALEERLPSPVLVLLLIQCAGVALLLGLGQRNWVLTGLCVLVMTASMAVILDMDDGNAGFIRVDRANLRDLVNILHQQEQL